MVGLSVPMANALHSYLVWEGASELLRERIEAIEAAGVGAQPDAAIVHLLEREGAGMQSSNASNGWLCYWPCWRSGC